MSQHFDFTDEWDYIMGNREYMVYKQCLCGKTNRLINMKTTFGYNKHLCNIHIHIFKMLYGEIVSNNHKDVINDIFNFVSSAVGEMEYITIKNIRTKKHGIFINPKKLAGTKWLSIGHLKDYTRMENKCCFFCQKQFIKTYNIIKFRPKSKVPIEIRVCPSCEYLFKMMSLESRSKNLRVIKELIPIIIMLGERIDTKNKKS
jgi:hypothetical protein